MNIDPSSRSFYSLVQAIFWLPGYLERTQGKLYKKMERQDVTSSTTKTKAKDSDAEEDDGDDALEHAACEEEKGNDDANEREKNDGGDIDSGNKKEN